MYHLGTTLISKTILETKMVAVIWVITETVPSIFSKAISKIVYYVLFIVLIRVCSDQTCILMVYNFLADGWIVFT